MLLKNTLDTESYSVISDPVDPTFAVNGTFRSYHSLFHLPQIAISAHILLRASSLVYEVTVGGENDGFSDTGRVSLRIYPCWLGLVGFACDLCVDVFCSSLLAPQFGLECLGSSTLGWNARWIVHSCKPGSKKLVKTRLEISLSFHLPI